MYIINVSIEYLAEILHLLVSAVRKQYTPLCKKATIHQVTTMLAMSKNVLFLGHNHLLTTGADDPILTSAPECRWLAGGYDLEIGH